MPIRDYIARTLARWFPVETRAAPMSTGNLLWLPGFDPTFVEITPEEAFRLAIVYSCVDVVASALMTLPTHVIDRDTGGREKGHDLASFLADDPNPAMTRASFLQAYTANMLMWGFGTAVIERDAAMNLVALWPIRSSNVRVVRPTPRSVAFQTRVGRETFTWSAEDILHTPAISFDGVTGVAPLEGASCGIGLAKKMERYAASFWDNGGTAGDVLELPEMKADSLKAFKDEWAREYGGPQNAYRPRVVPAGGKLHARGSNPEESQAVETRSWQKREICGVYRVPPHMVGDLERSTNNNIEHQGMEFRDMTLRPWAVKVEQEMTRKLLREEDKPRLVVRFNLDAIARADTQTRYNAHAIALDRWMTANEIRALEDLPPIPGGNVLRVPLNKAPAAGDPTPQPATAGA